VATITCQKPTVAIEFSLYRRVARRRKGALEATAAANSLFAGNQAYCMTDKADNNIRIQRILEAVERASRGEYSSDIATTDTESDDIGRLSMAINELLAYQHDLAEAYKNSLQASEEKSRGLIDSMMDAYATVDLSGRITDANTTFQTMLGYTMEELGRLTYDDLTPSKWHAIELNIIENQVLKQGFSEVYEKEYIRKDGSIFPVELRTFLMRDNAGREIGMWAIVRDITQRKETERELRVTTFCIHKASVGVFRMGSDGRILSANEQACKNLGYSLEEIMNLTVFDIDPAINPQQWKNHRSNLMASGTRTFESAHRRKDGSTFPVEITVNYIEYENEIYSYSFAADITEKKHAEEKRVQLEGQLRQAQKMEAVGQLAGGIAHDFNNLLQSISGFAQLLLLDKPEKDPDYSRLKGIRDTALRAGDLTRRLLTVSRNVDSDLKPLNLNREIHQAVELIERTIPKMIEIVLVLDDHLYDIQADSNQLLQILMNLSINASQAMPDGGTLVIETKNASLDQEYCQTHLGAKAGEYVVLTVSDTGVGMDRDTMDRIFDPFFTTKDMGQGTGLGLSMVYGIVKSHNGYIRCYSEPGQGTSFKIYFPAKMDADDHDRFRHSSESIPGGAETILLVDDEPDVLWVGREMLTRFGYQVMTAGSGEAALKEYTQNRDQIDLVMLDINMPGMGGHKCLEELVRLNPDIKVIVSSGYSPNGSIRRTLETGAGSFVGKPYQLSNMLNEVRRVLDS
jgi:PAS domain S-box-containing protein